MCVFMDKYFSQIISSFFLLTDFNRLAELSMSCPVFQKCDAMAHHIMNFEVLPESSLMKKYVCRPPDSASMAPISITTMLDATLQSI